MRWRAADFGAEAPVFTAACGGVPYTSFREAAPFPLIQQLGANARRRPFTAAGAAGCR